MKYLIVVLVVVLVVWLMLRSRAASGPAKRSAQRAGQPLEIVECRHCGVHLPRSECVVDGKDAYCSEAHRLAGARTP